MVEVTFDRSPHCWDVVNDEGDVRAADKWDREPPESDPCDKAYEEWLRRRIEDYIKQMQAAENPGDRARRRAMEKHKN
jgi:hypothetical protein